jgi:hypothetical protein
MHPNRAQGADDERPLAPATRDEPAWDDPRQSRLTFRRLSRSPANAAVKASADFALGVGSSGTSPPVRPGDRAAEPRVLAGGLRDPLRRRNQAGSTIADIACPWANQ